jgi:hypothetical protein
MEVFSRSANLLRPIATEASRTFGKQNLIDNFPGPAVLLGQKKGRLNCPYFIEES